MSGLQRSTANFERVSAAQLAQATHQETDPKAIAARILRETQIGSGENVSHHVERIEAALDKIADTNKALATAVRAEIMKPGSGLSYTDQGDLMRLSPSLVREVGNGQTIQYPANSKESVSAWFDRVTGTDDRNLKILETLAGSTDKTAVLAMNKQVFNGKITQTQIAAAETRVDEKAWTDGVGDFLARFSPGGRIMEAMQPAISSISRDAGIGKTEWGAKLQKILDAPRTMRAFNAGVASGMLEGAQSFVTGLAKLVGKTVQLAGDVSLAGLGGDALRNAVPDWIKGGLRDLGVGGALNEVLPSARRGAANIDALAKMGGAVGDYLLTRKAGDVVEDIKAGIDKIWKSVEADHAKAAAKGPEAEANWWGKLVGRVTFEVAATFVPVAGVAGKTANVAKVGDIAVDAVRIGDKVADVAKVGDVAVDAVRTGDKVTDVAKVGARTVMSLDDAAKLLRATTKDELAALRAAGMSNNKLGPAISVAVDLTTGKVSKVYLNNKIGDIPANFNKLLTDRLGPTKLVDYVKTAGAGSHSEIYAVNELLNGGAKLDNIAVYTEQVGGKFAGSVKPPCPHCNVLLEGVTYVK